MFQFWEQLQASNKEIGRFDRGDSLSSIFVKAIHRLVSFIGGSRKLSDAENEERQIQLEIERTLREAGIETAFERGGFLLFRSACYLAGPLIGLFCYVHMTTYYATVFTILFTGVGFVTPYFWLKGKAKSRDEEIQRELPLLIDLTNLGVSAGWDISIALESAIDSLGEKFPGHPLFREFRGARLLAASGYTWDEALRRVGNNLENDAVRRCTLALSQALRQGGDRSSQLDGIAQDAQRNYYAELDKRLAALPVRAILVTMVLMLSYMMIVLSPAVVSVKNTFSGFTL
ncbi:MAG: type II secretion system F family protein [Deltaproteobacteria bacterium]|nr:type II secretion system F family protein [Deltaproteobacteria bacterium]